MKGKFRILGNIGLALFLAVALTLAVMPAAEVEAATAVTDVWVEFPSVDAAGNLDSGLEFNKSSTLLLTRIHFKATTALVRGVDKIVVQFPDGIDTTMGVLGNAFTLGSACSTAANFDIDTDAAGTTYGYYDGGSTVTAAAYGGYRITLTIGVDIAAGSEVWLMIDDASNMVTSGAESTTAYKVKMYTSKDTTPVLSKGFYLGDDQVSTTSVEVSPNTAGADNAQYIVTFTPGETLAANTDTITVTFPSGTTVPSSISASDVSVYDGSSYYTCGVAPTIDTDLRTVKAVTPTNLTTGVRKIKFASTAGITNPTTLKTDYGDDTAVAKARIGFIRTSDEPEDYALDADGYTINETTATKLNITYNSTYGLSDKYTMINMYSSILYLQVEDQYGNLVDGGATASAAVTPTSSSATGNFYYATNSSTAYTQITGTKTLGTGALSLYYRDSAAGTHTLTVAYSGLTSATWTIQVAPAVSLYDRYDNLINTYAPTTASPVEETNASSVSTVAKGGYYVDNAIDAATAYDKVVLGDGSYETDSSTNMVFLDEANVTLKSLNGADYTTIDGSATASQILDVTAADVTIEGLTIKGLKTTGGLRGIYARYSGLTIQNNKFVDIPNDNIFLESTMGAITSGTITNNTLTGIGRNSTAWRSGLSTQSYASNAISGIIITNNTLSGFYGHENGAIKPAEVSGTVSEITIQGNTVTDSYMGIELYGSLTGLTGTKAVANNTLSGNVIGVAVHEADDVAFVLVKNTITSNNLYGIYLHTGAPAAATITIKYNDLSGNGTFGIYNTFTASVYDVIAKYNWWGDATGPGAGTGTYKSLTARGSGDNVTIEATWEPWLHKSLTDVVADNASYQAADMKLVVGWNTLSTPVKLIEAADTIDELIPGMTIGYYYDATGWQLITTGYTLSPCDAVYVKMSAVTYVLLKFDAGAFTTPSKDLAAGWNLISLAYLDSGGQTDLATVASVAKTAAGLPGYSQLVSPSLNAAQTDLYGTARSSWAYAYGQTGGVYDCYPGLGYWVYMQNAATLAGFEITPIVPAFGL